jgi:hypothetical protein
MMHRYRTPNTAILDDALDSMGSSPTGLAWALGAWIVRRFGPVKGGEFADAVLKSVQIETRKASREAPYIDVPEPEFVPAICGDNAPELDYARGLRSALIFTGLLMLLAGGFVAAWTTIEAVQAQAAAGAREW